MLAYLALFRKNLLDSKWLLVFSGATMFWLCWLYIFFTHRVERFASEQMMNGGLRGARGPRMFRPPADPSMDFGSINIEITLWKTPPLLLLFFVIWAIARGSVAVGGEIEKGTMDLVLSRPISRFSFLAAQVSAAVAGLLFLGAAIIAGHYAGAHFNPPSTSISFMSILLPTLNLVIFGFAIFGYTFFFSTMDLVRWRPNLIGSMITFGCLIANIAANFPAMSDYKKWLDAVSIFTAVDVLEAATKGETFAFNASLLGGIGLVGIILGMIYFSRRDIPAGS